MAVVTSEPPPKTEIRTWKIVSTMVPLDMFTTGTTEAVPGCWWRIPSWQVEIDHENLRGIDVRVHKAIGTGNGWDLSEGTTGFRIYHGLRDDSAEDVIALFCAVALAHLTPERFAKAIAKAKDELSRRPPCPFPAVP